MTAGAMGAGGPSIRAESEWVANELRRDIQLLSNNDNFGVAFDTYYDRRNGVFFYVNPVGGHSDIQYVNEGNPNRDRAGTARRLSLDVRTGEGTVRAELYTVDDDGGHRAPSETYLGYILTGLADARHPEEALDRVRRAAGK